MQSKAKSISEYFKSLPEKERGVVALLDLLIREILPEAVPSMKYGMPTYEYGKRYAAFNAQKQYFSVYLAPELLDPHRPKLKGFKVGKSCVRFTVIEKVPIEVFRAVLKSYRN